MKKRKSKIVFWLFLFPGVFAFTNTILIPFALGIVNSFTDWDGIALIGARFVGLENYREAFHDQGFRDAVLITIRYTAAVVIIVNVVGFSLAYLVTREFRSSRILQTLFFMPNMMGGLVLGFVWKFIFTKIFVQTGALIGAETIFYNWLNQPGPAFWSIVIASVWQMMGYVMLIYIAGLQSMPADVLEAAKIDGAGGFSYIGKILLPLVMPAISVCLFIVLNYSFKQFDVNLALTNGGPYGTTQMVALNIYNTAYKYSNFAFSLSKSIVMFVMVMVISLLQTGFTKKREVEL